MKFIKVFIVFQRTCHVSLGYTESGSKGLTSVTSCKGIVRERESLSIRYKYSKYDFKQEKDLKKCHSSSALQEVTTYTISYKKCFCDVVFV